MSTPRSLCRLLISPLFLISALASFAASADELPRGRVLERVACAGDARQSYALYLPASYSPDRSWPILYCLDPGARGRVPVERFAKAAEGAGWIIVGSNNSRNGPVDIAREAIEWMLRDTHARLAIDDTRIYTAGLSGGARLALAWAGNGGIAGVIASSAGFAGRIPERIAFRVYGTAGVDDFNFDEVYAMSSELSRRGVPQRFASFSGGHEWIPESLTEDALAFLSGKLPPEAPPPPTAEQKKAAQRFSHWLAELQSSDEPQQRSIVAVLQRDAVGPSDTVDRRVARRVLLGTYVADAEHGRELLAAAKYAEAAQSWEQAVLVRPDNAEAWYQLAVSRAATHEKRRALDALDRAIAQGFDDPNRIDHEKLFDALRNDPRFLAAVSGLRTSPPPKP